MQGPETVGAGFVLHEGFNTRVLGPILQQMQPDGFTGAKVHRGEVPQQIFWMPHHDQTRINSN
jgi:hypothetical protein